MSKITNISKIPEEIRNLVENGLMKSIEKGSLGKVKINFVQIENSLSGGKTGAAVFVARYGVADSKTETSGGTTYIRVLKIAPKEVCESENEGYVKTRETLLDIFSQVEYYPEDEFEYNPADKSNSAPTGYGILLYQDVGTVAASDLKGVARYLTQKVLSLAPGAEQSENFSRELSLLLQKEVFLGLKKGLYGSLQRKDVVLSEIYGSKLSKKVKDGIQSLREIDPSLPDDNAISSIYNVKSTYHQVNFIHGDLNPENVLVWENERGFLSCKLIDFGEVIPKKKENFTPLFWDFSRLMGEMILNFIEEAVLTGDTSNSTKVEFLDRTVNEFWSLIDIYFHGREIHPDSSPNAGKLSFIVKIYISTLFDFINEAKSGIKDLSKAEVLQDYFYCQILFFLFFTKFQKENPYKRLFGIKLALKMHGFLNSGLLTLHTLIGSLEKFYFSFSGALQKNKQPQVGPAPGAHSPFMGLSYFEEKDRDYFFGRERFTEELLKAIETKSVIALAGASGSGKSSIVHAGVIPLLREKNYLIYKFRPGANPYQAAIHSLTGNRMESPGQVTAELSSAVKSILTTNPGKQLFLLGDQFEEMFTICTDEVQRENLAVAIVECAREFKDKFKFFITIRSDFLTKLLEDSSFASIIGDSGIHNKLGARFLLGPMNVEELRSAIEKPLQVAGLKNQEGLTDLILTSISREPGSLPLLEFCLEELWKRQVDYTLTYDAYKQIGEVKGALATYADQVYADLKNSEKIHLKKIMLQLIQPGQGTEDTRRIALLEDVVSTVSSESPNKETEKLDSNIKESRNSDLEFIYKIADKRLIVTGTNESGQQTIEVVHEALIREWGKLRGWINADREFRVWQEKIRYSVKEWETGGKEEGLLLRGSSIIHSEDWFNSRRGDLSAREIEYIQTSIDLREKEFSLERERKERTRKIKRLLYIVGVAIFTFSIELSFFSFFQMKESKKNELKVSIYAAEMDYETKENFLENYYKLLKAGFFNLKISNNTITKNISSSKIKQDVFKALAKYTFDLKFIQNAKQDRNKSVHALREKYNLSPGAFIFSPNGSMFLTKNKSEGYIARDSSSGELINTIDIKSKYDSSAFFSSDSKDIITISRIKKDSDECIIKIRDLKSGEEKKYTEILNLSAPYTFNSNRNILASAGQNNTIVIQYINSDRTPFTLAGHTGKIETISFSFDGRVLVSASADKTIKIWDTLSGREIKTLQDPDFPVTVMSIGNYGKTLATAMPNHTIKIWDISPVQTAVVSEEDTGGFFGRLFNTERKTEVVNSGGNLRRVLKGHADKINSLDFSSTGAILASGSDDNRIIFWDIYTGQEVKTIANSENVLNIKLSPGNLMYLLVENQKSVSGYVPIDYKEKTLEEIDNTIKTKKIPKNKFIKLIFDLLYDTEKFVYTEKPNNPDILIENTNLQYILLKSCDYLAPQFDFWNQQETPPFPKREILNIKNECFNLPKVNPEEE